MSYCTTKLSVGQRNHLLLTNTTNNDVINTRMQFTKFFGFLLILLFLFITPAHAQTFPTIDPLTRELYELQITSNVITVTRTGSGPVYMAETEFRILGALVNNATQLVGFVQNPRTPYESTHMTFTNQATGGAPQFVSNKAQLSDGGCIDLHRSQNRDQSTYVATFCYTNSHITPGTQSRVVYGTSSNPFLELIYTGQQTTTLQFLSLAFNKYEQPFDADGLNEFGSRVNYLTIDTTHSSLTSFSNVKYNLQALTFRLTPQQYADLCTLGPTLPKKYMKQTTASMPSGGNNFELTTRGGGGCSFVYETNRIIPFFISLDQDGGIPFPEVATTPNPTPTLVPHTHCNPRGNIDCQGQVTLTDLSTLLGLFGVSQNTVSYNWRADFDNNGSISLSDLSSLLANFGK